MKRIISFCVFSAVFIFIFICISYLLRPVSDMRIRYHAYFAEEPGTLDVVALGSSQTAASWAPYYAYEESGTVSYTVGLDGLNYLSVDNVIKELYKCQKPRLLIIDLSPFQRDSTESTEVRVRRVTDSMPYNLNRMELVCDSGEVIENNSPDNMLSMYLDIMKYHDEWKHIGTESFYNLHYSNRKSTTKGFEMIRKPPVTLSDEVFTDYAVRTDLPRQVEDNLIQLLDFLRANEQETLFVVVPQEDSQERRGLYNSISDIVESYGFRYMNLCDYSKDMGIDYSCDFKDKRHLLITGAEKYTRYLSGFIHDNYDIPDRRTDERYSDWVIGDVKWSKEAGELKESLSELE